MEETIKQLFYNPFFDSFINIIKKVVTINLDPRFSNLLPRIYIE